MIDYYALLNIDYTASKKDIKKAYKREAFKWHPDKNKSDEANRKMQLINEAYLILKDNDAKLRYDKEYQRFTHFREEQSSQEYNINDDILNDWIKKAKVQAKDMMTMSFEDLVGMTNIAFISAWDRTKYYVYFLIVSNIFFFIFMK